MRLTRIGILLISMLAMGPATGLQIGPVVASASPTPRPSGSVSGPSQEAQAATGDETMRLFVGRSMVVRLPAPLKRVAVTDPSIASTVVVSPDQIMIHGLKPGVVTLLLWDEQEQLRSFDLMVLLDTRPIIANMKQNFPKENIEVSQSGPALALAGDVSSQAVADKAAALAQTMAPAVVNMLRVRSHLSNTVLLQVRFAEVDRSAVQQLGVNILSTGAGNTPGAISTQQFGAAEGANVGAIPSNVQGGGRPPGNATVTGAIGNALRGMPSVFGLSDLLNIFVFRPDLNLGLTIRALQQKNLLQILAEPNLMAASGQEASFLAGGEFPFPVVQGGTNFTAVTILFKEFGIKLKFTANMLDEGTIRLKVEPEVSSLDFANALTISGFLVPALSTRRTATEVELRDGQSFAIAGLIDNRLTESASKVPWLGDVPILGKIFRSRSTNRNNTELMVLVTPTLVKPLDPGQVPPGPSFPMPFLDTKKYDGQSGELSPPVKK